MLFQRDEQINADIAQYYDSSRGNYVIPQRVIDAYAHIGITIFPGGGTNPVPDYHVHWRNYSGINPNTPTTGGMPSQDPEKLYLYYMKWIPDGSLLWMEFEDDLTGGETDSDIQMTVETWIKKARRSQPIVGPNDLEWSGPCILVFFMDNEAWENNKEGTSANTIHLPNGVGPSPDGGDADFLPNFSFRDSRVMTLNLNPGPTEAIRCNNHHLLPDGSAPRPKPKPGEPPLPWDYYKLDLYFRVVLNGAAPGDKVTLIVDPSGKNTGP